MLGDMGAFRGEIDPQTGAKHYNARKSCKNIQSYQNRCAESEFACNFIKLWKIEEILGLLARNKGATCQS